MYNYTDFQPFNFCYNNIFIRSPSDKKSNVQVHALLLFYGHGVR